MSSYDYIVIGAGSAGCVLASRLTEDPDVSVLLLEAGGDGLLDVVRNPPVWPTLAGTERDWGYETVPQRGTGHVHAIPRGRGLGGSHSINAMAFMRGHPTRLRRLGLRRQSGLVLPAGAALLQAPRARPARGSALGAAGVDRSPSRPPPSPTR